MLVHWRLEQMCRCMHGRTGGLLLDKSHTSPSVAVALQNQAGLRDGGLSALHDVPTRHRLRCNCPLCLGWLLYSCILL